MVTLLMIIGALVGLAFHGFAGAVLGASLAWLAARSIRQERAIASIEQRLAQRTQTAELTAAVAPESEPAAPEVDAASALGRVAVSSVAAAPAAVSRVAERPAAFAPPPPTPVAPEQSALVTARQWLFGANTIVKAGIAILFLGLAFLAKYLSEHVHVPVEVRLAGIGLVAIVLTGIGWRLRTRRAAYAQVLQGGGIAVLYLTLFVSFRWYGVLGVAPAFALMAAVAALAAALAVLQDAPALAVVGTLGGFATPLLVSSGAGNHLALFSYYTDHGHKVLDFLLGNRP